MLGHLIRKEILDHILSLRFLILAGLGAVIIWACLAVGTAAYRDGLKDYRLSRTLTESHIRFLVEMQVLPKVTDEAYPVQKPPSALGIFVRGLELTLGRTGHLGGRDIRRLKFSSAAEEPMLGMFPPLDLARIVQVVLSLFVLLLTYDAVCGEKEGGTLSLTMSFPVPRGQLLLGKILGVLLSTFAAFVLPLLLGIAAVLLLPDIRFRGPEWIRLGLILTAMGLYIVAFACAGILGSCLTRRAATSFVVLLFFWAAAVAVLPRLSLIVADLFRPATSTQEFRAQVKALSKSHGQVRFDSQVRWEEDYLKRHGKQWWDTPAGREEWTLMRNRSRLETGEKVRSEARRVEEAFQNRYSARLDLAIFLARISPAYALNNATARLARTGMDRHRRFLEAMTTTRGLLNDWYWGERMQQGMSWAYPEKYEWDQDFSDVPRFTYRETWPDADLQTALVDIGMLALWGIVFFVGAYVAMLRYDLR